MPETHATRILASVTTSPQPHRWGLSASRCPVVVGSQSLDDCVQAGQNPRPVVGHLDRPAIRAAEALTIDEDDFIADPPVSAIISSCPKTPILPAPSMIALARRKRGDFLSAEAKPLCKALTSCHVGEYQRRRSRPPNHGWAQGTTNNANSAIRRKRGRGQTGIGFADMLRMPGGTIPFDPIPGQPEARGAQAPGGLALARHTAERPENLVRISIIAFSHGLDRMKQTAPRAAGSR